MFWMQQHNSKSSDKNIFGKNINPKKKTYVLSESSAQSSNKSTPSSKSELWSFSRFITLQLMWRVSSLFSLFKKHKITYFYWYEWTCRIFGWYSWAPHTLSWFIHSPFSFCLFLPPQTPNLFSRRSWRTFWRSVIWFSPVSSAWKCCSSSWLSAFLATSRTLTTASTASLS